MISTPVLGEEKIRWNPHRHAGIPEIRIRGIRGEHGTGVPST